jgi:hypothetical protein
MYADHEPKAPRSMADILAARVAPVKKSRANERGDLLKYFAEKMKWDIPRVARQVQGVSVSDLYALKSDCDQASARGVPWSAAFWTATTPESSRNKSTSNRSPGLFP